jgi:RHO1 GDP-GTP exchange protein 1/2
MTRQLSVFQSLFAYHIEELVPSSIPSAHITQKPQKLSGAKVVHFFSVGTLGGRTLVIYMKKKGVNILIFEKELNLK